MSNPPYRSTISTCSECGKTYANLYAHIEECTGSPRAKPREVVLTDEQVQFFREIHRVGSLPQCPSQAAAQEGEDQDAGAATGGTDGILPLPPAA